MLNLDSRIVSIMKNERRHNFTEKAQIYFEDGTSIWVNEDHFSISNNNYTDSSGGSNFPVGKTLCRTTKIEIVNLEGAFDSYNFFKSRIDLYLLFKDDDGEYIGAGDIVGTFYVVSPATMGDIISIDAVDAMYMLDKPFYSELTYPTTISALYSEICEKTVGSAFTGNIEFRNSDTILQTAPSGDYSFRDVIGFIAGFAGGYAFIDRQRKLQIKDIDLSIFETPEEHEEFTAIDEWSSLTKEQNDTRILGVSAKYSEIIDGKTVDTQISFGDVGENDYHIEMENPLYSLLADADTAESVLQDGYTRIVGFPFRVFDGDIPCDPRFEFMDAIRLKDSNLRLTEEQRYFYSFITDVTINILGSTQLRNSVPNSVTGNSSYSNPFASIINEVKKEMTEEITARESAVVYLTELINTHGGLYSFRETDPTTGNVTAIIIQDKPQGTNPQFIIRVTSSGIAMSDDGGATYQTGMTVDGQTITRLLYAEGISAEHITGDMIIGNGLSISVYDEDTKQATSLFDVINGRINIQISSATGNLATKSELNDVSETASEALAKASEEQTSITTTTGYKFDADGLEINKSDSDIINNVDNEGMKVKRKISQSETEDVLTANKEGVNAINLTARQYLTIGRNSRFEDYVLDGEQRTACFFIGESQS